MEDSLSPAAKRQLDRFCRQFLQAQLDLDYPSAENLRQNNFQQAIYNNLFAEIAVQHATPARHQFRVLKELIRRTEASIQDWDEEVGICRLVTCFETLHSHM